jgi:hypothetical protein
MQTFIATMTDLLDNGKKRPVVRRNTYSNVRADTRMIKSKSFTRPRHR